VRFALAWLIPTWIVFEALPTKLAHYTLPAYGALAWLAGAALVQPLGRRVRLAGAALQALVGLALAAGGFYLVSRYGTAGDAPEAVLAAVLLAGAGLAGGWFLLRDAPLRAVAAATGLGLLGHAALAAGLAPSLQPLWLSQRVEQALGRAQLLPSQGLADAPVTVAGYAEPSLVFELGTDTELGTAEDAAEAMVEHRPAVVESKQEDAFRRALADDHATAIEVAEIKGVDYSTGHTLTLRVYKAPDAPNGAVPGEASP
jgi:4-amino-4-deoxy-L-arabinose transferase-like glycosyltransferase